MLQLVILPADQNLEFFKKFVKIEYQDLGMNIDLGKAEGDYFLINEKNEYKVTTHF
ncbi:hypothetical protein SAMN05518672_101312 [Chitinophaga sp. CF118]|uniref:hypothetical protein n=1 Tax=Chitinophaga sp. CF118 TaxID=1884367 RepID=UPI0008E4B678|nr:hypothetical protein [Chitinophaga sp. CF118]SFD06874.1 hypothetical protein SAMN05518672_101312 [Chitinophaga sp. CF118]